MGPVAAEETPDAAGPGSVYRLSTLELDDLLDELRARAGSARAAQERLGALLDAVVAVSSDLELSTDVDDAERAPQPAGV